MSDFEEEIRSHIAHEADRLEGEGLPRREALAEARRRFGDERAVEARFLEGRRAPRLEAMVRDLVHAVRGLSRQPWFAAAAVFTLAVGVGLNAAIFNVLYGLGSRNLPLPGGDRLVTIHQEFPEFGMFQSSAWMGDAQIGLGTYQRSVSGSLDMSSLPEYRALRSESRSLESLAAFAPVELTVARDGPVAASGLLVSCDYFGVLGVGMRLGRAFAADECERAGEPPVVILSASFWRRQFGADEGVVGREIRVNNEPFTVIGVAEPGFAGTELYERDLWLPLTTQPRFGPSRLAAEDRSWLSLIGRLRPGATPGSAEAELNVIVSRWDATTPGRETKLHVYRASRMSQPGKRHELGTTGTATLLLTLFVLLMVCLNLMNLLLARAPARQQQVRIRLALGASRRRIVSSLLAESVLLALLGGAAGLALAYWLSPVAIRAIGGSGVQLDLSPDVRVLGFGLLIALGASITFGVLPALEATRVDLAAGMRGGTEGPRPKRGARLRHGIVAVQLAGSVALLLMAALLVRAIVRAGALDPGFAVRNVYAFRPELRLQGYGGTTGRAFDREFRDRVTALPGVEATALVAFLPLGARSTGRFHHGTPPAEPTPGTGIVDNNVVSSGYLEVVGVPVLRGRTLEETDERADGPVAAVISQSMAEGFWPGEDPLGQIFSAASRVYRVVGVARDAENLSLGETDRAYFYAAAQVNAAAPASSPDTTRPPDYALIVRASPGSNVTESVLGVARAMDPGVLVSVDSFEALYDEEIRPARIMALFAGIFGLLATVLAVVGVYGAIACTVSLRTREIGVRVALGAAHGDIVRLVVRQALAALAVGVTGGMLLAGAGSFLARGLLFGLPPFDPLAFGGTVLIMMVVAVAAMARPARRAARTDPMLTLRHE